MIDHVVAVIAPIVESYDLAFSVLDSIPGRETQIVRLDTTGIKIEPAPMTPVEGPAFELMGGTLKHLFPSTVVVPSAMTAFTDTQCESYP